jgi:hypothetical protein
MEVAIGLVKYEERSGDGLAPVISVDRATWYQITDIEIDYQSISTYYESLPHPNKPRLADCRIHISGLACVVNRNKSSAPSSRVVAQESVDNLLPPMIQRRRQRFFRKHFLIDGVHFLEPSDARLFDPLAPSADILLLLGSSIFMNDLSRLVVALEKQLEAYALDKASWPPMSSKEKELRVELKRQEQVIRKDLGAPVDAVEGAVEEGVPSLLSLGTPLSTLTSIGVGAASHIYESRSERSAFRKARNGLLACMEEREAITGTESPPVSLSAHAVKVQLRSGIGLRNTMLRAPYGSGPFRSWFDYAVDQAHMIRSLHRQPLTNPNPRTQKAWLGRLSYRKFAGSL